MLKLVLKHFGPRSTNPDIHRKELVLNSILGFCFCLILVFEILATRDDTGSSRVSWLYLLLIISPFFASYYFSRIGKVTLASSIFIATFSVGILYAMALWGITLPATLLSLVLMTTLTGILVSSRAGFVYALGAGIILASYVYLFNTGAVVPDLSWSKDHLVFPDIIELTTFLLFISGLSWISNRQMELSLKRARNSEHELKLERDQLEVTVANRTKALEQAQIEKISELYTFIEFGKLSAGLIHDLMSPLSAVCIELETNNNPNVRSSLNVSANNLVSSGRKIQDMIKAARRQIQINLKEEYFIPRDIILETITLHKHRLQKAQIILHHKITAGNTVRGYPSLFSHIITNLLSNAIDACEDARVQFRDKEYRPQISIDAHMNGNTLTLSIKDNGIGISPEIASNIFNPFFTTKDNKGCGYGLPASKHIAEKYFQGDLKLIKHYSVPKIYHKTNQFRTTFELIASFH